MTTESASGERMMQTLERIDQFGVRFTGSPQERQAADWIEERFRESGLEQVRQEEFPCRSFGWTDCEIEVKEENQWRKIPSEPAAHSPSTPSEGIEAELQVVEKLTGPGATKPDSMRGRVVLIYSSEFYRLKRLRHLCGARPAAVLVVDDRFTHNQPVAVGFPRFWIDELTCPFVNISLPDAWRMAQDGISRVRVRVAAETPESISTNVIGEIPGTGRGEEVVVVSAHHDTVINSSGVDDNGSGVACVLELAGLLVGSQPARTIRFISFGAEEQLSEGARCYVESCGDLEAIRFVLNVDAVAAWLGKSRLYYAGPPELGRILDRVTRRSEVPIHRQRELSPFSDHFPFNCRGIPAVWYYRPTCESARHYHHSRMENLTVISPQVLARTVRHQRMLLEEVAIKKSPSITSPISAADQKRLEKLAAEWLGG